MKTSRQIRLEAEAKSMSNATDIIEETVPNTTITATTTVQPESISLQTEVAKPIVDDTIYADVDYANAYKPYRITKEYKDTTGLKLEVYNHILFSDKPICLIGDKGVGKTALIHDVSVDMYEDGKLGGLITLQGNYNTSDRHMIGFNRLRGMSGEAVKGAVVNAICLANYYAKQGKIVIFYIDELPNIPTEVSIILASLLDGRRMIQTQDGKVWKLEPEAKLVVVASGNPSHYAGVNTLQEALLSRFTGFYVGYPSDVSIKQIIDFDSYGITPDVYDPLLQLCADIHGMKQKNDLDYVISPRDLFMFCEEYQNRMNVYEPRESKDLALSGALEKCILFNYQDLAERELVKQSINDTFNIKLDMKFS